ncbi:hypothetical protein G6N05_11255 [Flavobacterium sp. F372]|uniref:Tail specific protease domain-containing protein n=1 Tax=Flavobacterium bernardetii TaxID=2813823 RepID=A0ABR7IZJ4_9FLAO|nr:S41 family peptidase [Flavobacterium bernardetii]MBC5835196.1 hypothetical protein [Flavobacterium bernardetii]NHF70688.1 hypothetical protein [Flavobacterium bernardetii]
MKIIFSINLFFIAIFAFGQTTFQSQKVEDFAKLYGVVRYFHPSDESAKIDWKAFAVYGVKEINKAKNQEEFEQKLKDLFLPIAPSISFHGDYYKWDKNLKYPVYWEHRGLGVDSQKKNYKSERFNKSSSEKSFKAVAININENSLKGKKIKLVYESQTKEGKAYCYLKLLDSNKKSLKFATHQNSPVVSDTWELRELFIDGLNDFYKLSVGLVADEGNCSFRNLKLYFENSKNNWEEIKLPAFDNKEWYSIKKAQFNVVKSEITILNQTDQINQLKNTDITINWDKYYTVKLSNDVNVVVPIVVYANETNTLPISNIVDFKKLKQSIETTNTTEFNQEISVANIIIIWNIFKHFYPYQNEVVLDWNKVLQNGTKDAYDDKDGAQHKLTLEKFTENFKDAHINIFSKSELLVNNSYSSPISFRWVGEKLVVKDVMKDYDGKLKKGDVINEINNKPTAFVLDSVSQYISGSKQWKKWVAIRRINRGAENTSLLLKNENNLLFDLKRNIKFKDNKDFFEREGKKGFEEINKDIYYINHEKLNAGIVDSLIPIINKHKGLIIDLRGYAFNDQEHSILSYTSIVDTTKWLCPAKIYTPDYSNIEEDCSGHKLNTYKANTFLKTKNVLLVDERSISNTEMLAQVVKHYKIATILGRPTAGANGNINEINLLNGFKVIFTGMKVKNPDGSQFHSIGVIPDVLVKETVEDIKQGRDSFMEKAIEVLNKEI